jgi:hypothetical protein
MSSDAYLQKGKAFEKQGNEKLKSGNFLTKWFSDPDQKIEDACELFQ